MHSFHNLYIRNKIKKIVVKIKKRIKEENLRVEAASHCCSYFVSYGESLVSPKSNIEVKGSRRTSAKGTDVLPGATREVYNLTKV